MTRRRYQGLEVKVEGETLRVSAAAARARRLGRSGRYEESLEIFHWLAQGFEARGMPMVVLDLIEDLHQVVPSDAIDRSSKAWLLNLEGIAYQELGRYSEAATAFQEMRRLGSSLSDPMIESTALQNLGIHAMHVSDGKRAKEHFRDSFALKERAGDSRGAVQVLVNLCTMALDEGDLTAAESVIAALEPVVRAAQDPGLLTSIEGLRGNLAAKRSEFLSAEQHYRNALKNARRIGDLGKELTCLKNLGSVKVDLGDPGQGIRWYRRGLRLAEALNVAPEVHALSIGLAVTLHRSGREREAAQRFEQARNVARRLGDTRGWARATADLGALKINLQETQEAEALLVEALQVFRELDDREWSGTTLRNLAALARATGDLESARGHAAQALAMILREAYEQRADIHRFIAVSWVLDPVTAARAVPHFQDEVAEVRGKASSGAVAWRAITAAALLAQARAFEESLPFYAMALRTYSRIRDAQWAFHARNDRAIALSALHRFRDARRDLRACLALARRLNDRAMKQRALANLGEVSSREGKLAESARALRRAITLARSLQDLESEAWSLCNLGIVLMRTERWEEAREAFVSGERIAAESGAREPHATAIGGLAGIALFEGRFSDAADLYERALKLRGHDQDEHHVEELAGLTESLCGSGRLRRAERIAQEMVEAAQRLGVEQTASEGLARSGRWLLRQHRVSEAANYYATSIAVVAAGIQRKGLSGEALAREIAQPLTFLAVHAADERGPEQDVFSELVLQKLNEDYDGLGEELRDLFRISKSTVVGRNFPEEPRGQQGARK
jgi:tetratricopeptide (TPR) repeat protein